MRNAATTITTIGLDIAKSVFQVHAIDASGQVVARQQLKRARVIPFFSKLPPCTIGIEACATSHYWARELTALGHTVKLMPPAYVKPFVKSARRAMRLTPKRSAKPYSDRACASCRSNNRSIRQLSCFTVRAISTSAR